LFDQAARKAGKELYLIPYFIAAHPGTSDEDMMNLALWLKRNGFRADQVQTFMPTPMSLSSAMYYSQRNPLKPVRRTDGAEVIDTARGLRQRRLHKAFLRYHDPDNWPLLREALRRMGRNDLIGGGKQCLVPIAARGPAGRRDPRQRVHTKDEKVTEFYTQQAGKGRRRAGVQAKEEARQEIPRQEKSKKQKSRSGKPARSRPVKRPGRTRA
jgi:hypothetical protein